MPMSSVNKRYSHSFAQTSDDSVIGQSQQDAATPSTHDEQTLVDVEEQIDDPPYPEASPEELRPPSDFRPFFTLVEDPDTGDYHHPAVHYIFSDDNPDFVTSAIVEAIDHEQAAESADKSSINHQERMILLDVGLDGRTITDAQSLSPNWQISKTTVGQAPSWADEPSRKDVPGLMLSIQGTESHKLKLQPSRRRNSQDDPMARVEAMIGGYNECLATLESLMKKDVLEQDEQEEQEVPNQDEKSPNAPEEGL